jgi:hypothetical protein
MSEFEVIEIKKKAVSFQVEVELPDRSRRFFGYPIGEGWENDLNNQPKFIWDIHRKLDDEILLASAKSTDITDMTKKMVGKKFSNAESIVVKSKVNVTSKFDAAAAKKG